MPESQKNEPFETPPADAIPEISRMHVQAMEAGYDEAWEGAGMKQVLLRTVGRKSGKAHKVALPFWSDDDGSRIVVGSFAGAVKHPAWYLNLSDRAANPEVYVRHRDEHYWAEARILDGDEYTKTWGALTGDRPFYNDYQAKTERRIPLIRLVKKRTAEGAPE